MTEIDFIEMGALLDTLGYSLRQGILLCLNRLCLMAEVTENRIYHQALEKFTTPQRFGQGYEWELDKSWYMGDKHSEMTFGHTGFTGTQVIFDPSNDLQIIVLTNKQNNGPLESESCIQTLEDFPNISRILYTSLFNNKQTLTSLFL